MNHRSPVVFGGGAPAMSHTKDAVNDEEKIGIRCEGHYVLVSDAIDQFPLERSTPC